MYGYHGKILFVDLSSGTFNIHKIEESFARKYIGGNGFGAAILNEMDLSMTHPFDAENPLVLSLGPFNGSGFYGSGRGHGATISPQTGFFADSNFGGDFAIELKNTGFDALVITGKADEPVYIIIDNEIVIIKKAIDIWGLKVSKAHRYILENDGPDFQSALIGPAGENCVIYSNIICSGKRISAAGRGGLGAVLGSKRCKGIAVRGTQKTTIADSNALSQLQKEILPTLRDSAQSLTETGTPVLVNIINEKGKLCTRNASTEVFKNADKISGEVIREKYKKRNCACKNCPIACGKIVTVPEGHFKDSDVKMPEYETIYAMGSMLENSDIVSIFNGNAMCDEMGIDTISFGVTLSFIAESVEKGLIPEEHLERHVLFGDNNSLDELVSITAYRKGNLGEYLSMGSERLARLLGDNAKKILYTVKGMEIAGHSARGLRNMGLGYATGTRGGSHHDARPIYYADDPATDPGFDDVHEKVLYQQNNTALGDSLVVCRFITERTFTQKLNEKYLPFIKAVTGWDMTMEELNEAGERIYNLERYINTKRGLDRTCDTLPFRVMNEPIAQGPSKGFYCTPQELQRQLDKYYTLRGWNKNGVPTFETLERLGID